MDFGFQFELSSSALGGLRLDSVGLATGSPVDAGLGGLAVGPTPAVALGTPVRVSALLNPAAMPDWTAGVNLLTLSFTLGSGAPGTPFTLTAGNGKATIDFVEDESWTASASLDVARQVPEGGTLVSVLIALGVLGWVQRRRG